MKYRRYHLRPPTSGNYVSMGVIELSAADDTLNAGKPTPPTVVLTPADTPLVIDLLPEDEATTGARREATRRTAFLAELARSTTVALDPSPGNGLYPGHWADVLPDPSVWPALTAFLTRTGRARDNGTVESLLTFGRGPLADYWLTTPNSALRTETVRWLGDNWRAEWERLTEPSKRALVEHFADRLARSEAAADAHPNRGEDAAPGR